MIFNLGGGEFALVMSKNKQTSVFKVHESFSHRMLVRTLP